MTESMFCKHCFQMVAIEHDGRQGYCVSCGKWYALHVCPWNGLADAPRRDWLELAMPLISEVCLGCGLAVGVGQKLEAVPDAPVWVKELGGALVAGGIIVGGLMVLDWVFGDRA